MRTERDAATARAERAVKNMDSALIAAMRLRDNLDLATARAEQAEAENATLRTAFAAANDQMEHSTAACEQAEAEATALRAEVARLGPEQYEYDAGSGYCWYECEKGDSAAGNYNYRTIRVVQEGESHD
jgi:chromosome segregation ATPase